ncbi:MAG: diphthamide synthesis protein [Candidatus Parvarchaeota archaeon]|jgi:2-(3-amino-3-carboxypropyl)histidine synthase|nr:diphthamide synthesis protein [Candidatus Parvarchaeota archaeon]MCL5106750.1 diphthamide synthesis protein [Candidatus Parvarchaeota archaeon]
MEMIFVESRFRGKLSDEFVKRIYDEIKAYKKINLVAAIQFIDQMNDFKNRVKDKEFVVKQSLYRAMYPGQILGCDVYAADCKDCDATLAFEQGMFHVLGIPLKYGKAVITADPETENIEVINAEVAEKYRKRIMQGIGAVLTAKKVMFVESTKAGQTYGSKMLKEKLRKDGKQVYSVVADEINFDRLNEFREIDVFVSTACQRIAIDDMNKVKKPMINAEDLESYLSENK